MYFEFAGGPGKGVHPAKQRDIPMINRTGGALSKGAVVLIDEAMEDPDGSSTNLTPGADGSGYRHVITPTAGNSLNGGTFMVYQGTEGTLADDAEGLFATLGLFDVDIETGAVDPGDVLVVKAATQLDRYTAIASVVNGQKRVAKARASRASGSALVPCFFNGYGFEPVTAT